MLERFAMPRVSITLAETNVFLNPVDDSSTPSQDPLLHGAVNVTLTSPTALSNLTVVLTGQMNYSAGARERYISTKPLHKVLKMDLSRQVLPAGTHTFAFTFIVPSSAPPTQSSTFGRTFYQIEATLVTSSGSKLPITLHSRTSSAKPVRVTLTACPQVYGELPAPLSINLTHTCPDLGLVQASFASPYLTVASHMAYSVSLPSLPDAVKIKSVRAFVAQSHEVHYDDGGVDGAEARVVRTTPNAFWLEAATAVKKKEEAEDSRSSCAARTGDVASATSSPSPFASAAGLDSSAVQHARACSSFTTIARLPTHHQGFTPTTLPGTTSPMRVSHALGIEVTYSIAARETGGETKDEEDKKFVMSAQGVVFASCRRVSDSVYLPSYTTATATASKLSVEKQQRRHVDFKSSPTRTATSTMMKASKHSLFSSPSTSSPPYTPDGCCCSSPSPWAYTIDAANNTVTSGEDLTWASPFSLTSSQNLPATLQRKNSSSPYDNPV